MKPIYDTIQMMQEQYRTEYGGEQWTSQRYGVR
jgi:hypothetical protein